MPKKSAQRTSKETLENSQVFYRKYRPDTFGDVAGQEIPRAVLQNAVLRGKIGHAYLFAGERGSGKTSLARIFAKTINCLSLREKLDDPQYKEKLTAKDIEPCNQCAHCRSIQNQQSMDVIEIDAASNRGIDEIRQLREVTRFKPSHLFYKVFIIDEVHMLTKDAFNALLKTLEEPPAYAVFIMATTELHKVLPTIQSRSQRLIFEKLSREDILHVLARIARAEQLDIADDALDIIARAGRGSLRDAESVLNGIAVIADGTITADAVKQLLNMADFSQALEFLSAILSGNAIQALDMVEDLARRSLNEEEFLKYCILILEKTLIIAQTKNEGLLEDSFTTEEIYDLIEFGKRFAQTTMLTVVRILLEYYANIKDYPSPLMALEMATIEALAANGTSEQSVSDKNKHNRSGGSALSSDDAAAHSAAPHNAAQPSAYNSTINKIHFSTVAALKKIQDNWAGIIEDLKPFNYSLAALFGAATLVNLVGDELIIRVKYGFHKERLEATKNRLEIERILQEVSGEKLHLACVVGEDEQAQSAANVSSASATHQPSAPAYTY